MIHTSHHKGLSINNPKSWIAKPNLCDEIWAYITHQQSIHGEDLVERFGSPATFVDHLEVWGQFDC